MGGDDGHQQRGIQAVLPGLPRHRGQVRVHRAQDQTYLSPPPVAPGGLRGGRAVQSGPAQLQDHAHILIKHQDDHHGPSAQLSRPVLHHEEVRPSPALLTSAIHRLFSDTPSPSLPCHSNTKTTSQLSTCD